MQDTTDIPDVTSIRNRVFRVLFLIAFTTQMGIGIISPALPLYAQMLGLGGFALGLITSSFALGRTIFMPIGGTISDIWGRKRILLIGLCGYSLFSGCYILASSFETLVMFRFLHGLSAAMVFPITTAYVGDLTESGKEGRTMGTLMSFAFLGMSFGPLIGGMLFEYIGHNTPFICLSFIAAINVILALIVLPDYNPKNDEKFSILAVIADSSMRIPMLFYFSYSICYSIYISFFSTMVLNENGVTAGVTGCLMSLNALSMVFFQKKTGFLIDKHQKNLFLAGGMMITGLSMLILTIPSSLPPYAVLCIILGAGFGISLTTASAMTTIAGRRLGQGKTSSGVNTAQSLGLMVAPPLMGYLCGTDYKMVFFLTGIFCCLMIPVWYCYGSARTSSSASE